MASDREPFCTDEELINELKKLGYNDVSPDVFQMMKKDLSQLVEQKYHSEAPHDGQENQSTSTKTKLLSPLSVNNVDDQENTKSSPKEHSETLKSAEPNPNDEQKLSESSPPSDAALEYDYSFRKYLNRLNYFKVNSIAKRHGIKITPQSDSSSPSVSTENKIKRKVLRHKDGKPVITEELVDIPGIFNTSYPETQTLDSSSSSFSSDELSWKTNSSTGSISALSPDSSLGSSPTTCSLSSKRSVQSRLTVQRKKKNDPVSMYNYYKKYWNDYKPPGEKTHDKLRWAVRDKMLDYNL